MSTYPAVGSREVKRALRSDGWVERVGKGHTVFHKGARVVVVDDDVKRFSTGLLGAMRRQTGLSRQDFIRKLKGET